VAGFSSLFAENFLCRAQSAKEELLRMTAVLQSSPDISTGAYCWRIDNYQHLASAPGVATESPSFEVEGIQDHAFCVCLYPGGYHANSDGKAAESVSC
jgi:hypothetical protein